MNVIFLLILAAYTPGKVGYVAALNDPFTITIPAQNEWVQLDGFSQSIFLVSDPGYDADTDGTGLIINHPPGAYHFELVGHYKKVSGANAVTLGFCFTLNGVCISPTLKVTVDNATNYNNTSSFLDLPTIIPGATYGVSVRNETNGDNLIMDTMVIRAERRN